MNIKNLFKRKHKVAETPEKAFKIQEKYSGMPHGWVQWKGTDVCMDVRCKCGAFGHIDADFAYNVKCIECGTIYTCSGFIEFIEVKEANGNCVVSFRDED